MWARGSASLAAPGTTRPGSGKRSAERTAAVAALVPSEPLGTEAPICTCTSDHTLGQGLAVPHGSHVLFTECWLKASASPTHFGPTSPNQEGPQRASFHGAPSPLLYPTAGIPNPMHCLFLRGTHQCESPTQLTYMRNVSTVLVTCGAGTILKIKD